MTNKQLKTWQVVTWNVDKNSILWARVFIFLYSLYEISHHQVYIESCGETRKILSLKKRIKDWNDASTALGHECLFTDREQDKSFPSAKHAHNIKYNKKWVSCSRE